MAVIDFMGVKCDPCGGNGPVTSAEIARERTWLRAHISGAEAMIADMDDREVLDAISMKRHVEELRAKLDALPVPMHPCTPLGRGSKPCAD